MDDLQRDTDWNADAHDREARSACHTDDERDQEDKADLEEHGNARDETDKHHRPVRPLLSKAMNQRARQAFSAARSLEHLAENTAEAEYRRQKAQGAAHARFDGFADR